MDDSRKLEEKLDILWSKLHDLRQLGREVATQKGQAMEGWLQKVDHFESEVYGIIDEFDDIQQQGRRGTINQQLALERKVTRTLKTGEYLEEEGKDSLEQPRTFLKKWGTSKLERFWENDIRRFTSNFSNNIGSGGFGNVFRGKFDDGRKIAVKVLREDVGRDLVEETFKAEVETVASTTHRYLVTLHGYCFEANFKALVYEYMENGSLDRILSEKRSTIEWGQLYNIAIETAMGIGYLHDGCHQQIIHYDIKPPNVLIHIDLSPKLTDFGIAMVNNRDVSIVNPGQRGTFGYMAPELMTRGGKVSYKCDVYSYGMTLFDILWRSKETNGGEANYVREKLENGQLDQLLQQLCIDQKYWDKARTLCKVALRCVQYAPESRPKMREVVSMLENVKVDTPTPSTSRFQHHEAMNQPSKQLNPSHVPFSNYISTRRLAGIAQTSRGKEAASGGSKHMLESFQKMCPPGGENSVIIYTTSLSGISKTYDASRQVLSILESYKIQMEERDVYLPGTNYKQQLQKLLGRVVLPSVFVKGWYIGGVDELVKIDEENALKDLLHGIPRSAK